MAKTGLNQCRICFLILFIPAALGVGNLQSEAYRPGSFASVPFLGRGYSVSTNKFYDNCLTDVLEQQNKYDFELILSHAQNSILESASLFNFLSYSWLDETANTMRIRALSYRPVMNSHGIALVAKLNKYASAVDDQQTRFFSDVVTLIVNNSIVGFIRSCGPNYVRSIRRTGELSAMFSYLSSSILPSSEFETGIKKEITNPVEADDSLAENYARYATSITIHGIGLGINKDTSSTLVANSLLHFRSVLKFAFNSMQKDATGIPDSIEIVPWSHNKDFLRNGVQLMSKSLESDLGINVLNARKKFNLLANAELMAFLDDYVQGWMNEISTLEKCISDLHSIPANKQRRYVRNRRFSTAITEKQPEGIGVTITAEDTRSITVARLKKLLSTRDEHGIPLYRQQTQQIDDYLTYFYFPCLDKLSEVDGTLDGGTMVTTHWTQIQECTIQNCVIKGAKWDVLTNACKPQSQGIIDETTVSPNDYIFLVDTYCLPEIEDFSPVRHWPGSYYASCVTNSLKIGQSLGLNEHLCSEENEDHKFGLDNFGKLVVFDNYSRKNYFLESYTGDRLELNSTGVLILYNRDDIVDCLPSPCSSGENNAMLSLNVDENANVILKNDDSPDETPVVVFTGHNTCTGSELAQGDWLFFKEYICEGNYRFGIDENGRLIAYDSTDRDFTTVYFSTPILQDKSTAGLKLQQDGNLVLLYSKGHTFHTNTYNATTSYLWKVGIQTPIGSNHGYITLGKTDEVLDINWKIRIKTHSDYADETGTCINTEGVLRLFDVLYANEYICTHSSKYKLGVDRVTKNIILKNVLINTKVTYNLVNVGNFNTIAQYQGREGIYSYDGRTAVQFNPFIYPLLDLQYNNLTIYDDGFVEVHDRNVPVPIASFNSHLDTCALDFEDYINSDHTALFGDGFSFKIIYLDDSSELCLDSCDGIPCMNTCTEGAAQEFKFIGSDGQMLQNSGIGLCVGVYDIGVDKELEYYPCNPHSRITFYWDFIGDFFQDDTGDFEIVFDGTVLKVESLLQGQNLLNSPYSRDIFRPVVLKTNQQRYAHPFLLRSHADFTNCVTLPNDEINHKTVVKVTPCEPMMPVRQRWVYDMEKKYLRSMLDIQKCITMSPEEGQKVGVALEIQYCHAFGHTLQKWDWDQNGRIRLHSDASIVLFHDTTGPNAKSLVTDISGADPLQQFLACGWAFRPRMKGRCLKIGDDNADNTNKVKVAPGNYENRQDACQMLCIKHRGYTGCEVFVDPNSNDELTGCYVHTDQLQLTTGEPRSSQSKDSCWIKYEIS